MPRVSAAHEQEIRERILDAASRVFAEKGYHSSTIADVVRESGLSVGAIYSYFSGKDELIRLTCDQIAARGLDELAERLAPATTTRERLAGAGQLLLRQGVISGELPAWLDVDAVTRALLALLDGLMLQRIEAGDSYRPADLERRAMAMVELLLGARSMAAGAAEPLPTA